MNQYIKGLWISSTLLFSFFSQDSFAISREQMKILADRVQAAGKLTHPIVDDIQALIHEELETEIQEGRREANGHKHASILRHFQSQLKATQDKVQFEDEFILQYKILSIWFLKDYTDEIEQEYWTDFFHRIIQTLETLKAHLVTLDMTSRHHPPRLTRSESIHPSAREDSAQQFDLEIPEHSSSREDSSHAIRDSEGTDLLLFSESQESELGRRADCSALSQPIHIHPVSSTAQLSPPGATLSFCPSRVIHPRIEKLRRSESLSLVCRVELESQDLRGSRFHPHKTTYGFLGTPRTSLPPEATLSSPPPPDESFMKSLSLTISRSGLLFDSENAPARAQSSESPASTPTTSSASLPPESMIQGPNLPHRRAQAQAQQASMERLYKPSRYDLSLRSEGPSHQWTAVWNSQPPKKPQQAKGDVDLLEFGPSYRVALSRHLEKESSFEGGHIAQWYPSAAHPLDHLGIHEFGILGILDGHGGRETLDHATTLIPAVIKDFLSELSREQISQPEIVRKTLENAFTSSSQHPDAPLHDDFFLTSIDDALRKHCESWKGSLRELHCLTSGASATIAIFINQNLYIAQLGDTRATLVPHSGKAQRLTVEHYPEHPEETKMIERLGGFITPMTPSSPPRLDGVLSTSRALGSWYTARKDSTLLHIGRRPDITHVNLKETPMKALLLMTNGITHGISSDYHLGEITTIGLARGTRAAAREIHAHSLASGSLDNSMVLVLRTRSEGTTTEVP